MRVQKVQKVQRVQRVVVSPSRAMSIKSALRDILSVSYDMIIILQIDSLRSPPFQLRRTAPACGGKVVAPATKGGMPEWYMKYMTLCFSPQIPCFPLRGNAT